MEKIKKERDISLLDFPQILSEEDAKHGGIIPCKIWNQDKKKNHGIVVSAVVENQDQVCKERDVLTVRKTFCARNRESRLEVNEEEDTNSEMKYDDEFNDDEKKQLKLMRTTVEMQDPACKGMDDLTLRRFLRARDLDVEKASAMLMKYLTWRKTYISKGFISMSEIANELAQNKIFMQGKDKKGRPIAVLFGARHFPCKGSLEEFKRFNVFILDKLCSRIPDGQEKFTIIGDLEGYGYSNIDFRGSLAALSILQDYFPERLGKLFVIHVPYIFMTLWKAIYPFIDKNTKKKINFVENKKLQCALLEDIDESQLPEIYGGKMKLIPIQDA